MQQQMGFNQYSQQQQQNQSTGSQPPSDHQSFNLTDETEDKNEEEPIPTQTSKKSNRGAHLKAKAKKNQRYRITSRNQETSLKRVDPKRGVAFGGKILDVYNIEAKRRGFIELTKNMLTGKWTPMNASIQKFNQLVAKTLALSGENDEDWITRVEILYKTHVGTEFKHKSAWLFLKGKHKWTNPESTNARRYRFRVTDEELEHFGDDALPQPPGLQRIAKSQRFGSNSTASSGANPPRVRLFAGVMIVGRGRDGIVGKSGRKRREEGWKFGNFTTLVIGVSKGFAMSVLLAWFVWGKWWSDCRSDVSCGGVAENGERWLWRLWREIRESNSALNRGLGTGVTTQEALFSLKIHYAGYFTESPSRKNIMHYSFLKPDMNLDTRLYALGNDDDVRIMSEYIRLRYKMVEKENDANEICESSTRHEDGESSQPKTTIDTAQTEFATDFYTTCDPLIGQDFDPFFGLDGAPVDATNTPTTKTDYDENMYEDGSDSDSDGYSTKSDRLVDEENELVDVEVDMDGFDKANANTMRNKGTSEFNAYEDFDIGIEVVDNDEFESASDEEG
uniref:Uncharacterized protein n=1 Tax=Tanacetum cinerariifolium TaxID=118510 RepID=A0A6L2NS86_TANCI|nr:hypothetical protein [Tanacetum cinerariifolium]